MSEINTLAGDCQPAPAAEAPPKSPSPTSAWRPNCCAPSLDEGYTKPTPIQAQAIPLVISGKDIMGGAQTGTGKTAAFVLPILQRILPFASSSPSPARHPVRALILAPTRELALQVFESVKSYSKHTPIRAMCAFGGVDIKPQIAELKKGVEILVATPGRLLDHVENKSVSFNSVQALVLDEADRMLDMGFIPDVTRILNMLPAQRQSLLVLGHLLGRNQAPRRHHAEVAGAGRSRPPQPGFGDHHAPRAPGFGIRQARPADQIAEIQRNPPVPRLHAHQAGLLAADP
jgi:ATP-dependent RNA helicase RhlE